MKIVATALLILLSWWASSSEAACTQSNATAWVSTPDQASVSSCVSSASTGDTIKIVSGSATWASAVTIPAGKSLTIIGAGIGSTIIGTSASDRYVVKIASDNTRITNIEFNCSTVYAQQVQDFRIDHNKFTCAGAAKQQGVFNQGSGSGPDSPRGLIDNNEFVNMRINLHTHPKASVAELQGSNHWTRGPEFGTGEGIYIEDNSFYLDGSSGGGNVIDCQFSSRYVARFNHVIDSLFEVHSAQGTGSGTARGCRGGEIYGNYMEDTAGGIHPYYIFFVRAGSWMVFNNTASTGFEPGGAFRLDNVRSCTSQLVSGRADGTSGWDADTSPTSTYRGYLARDQPGAGADVAAWGASDPLPPAQGKAPIYAWLNTYAAADLAPNVSNNPSGCTDGVDYNTTHIVENRDYYTYKSTFDGTVGVGSGTLASRPSTCTTGVGFWVTDQGEWNSRQDGPDGQLYKCTATNTWTLDYKPFPYPHPLQSSTKNAFLPPPTPRNVYVTNAY